MQRSSIYTSPYNARNRVQPRGRTAPARTAVTALAILGTTLGADRRGRAPTRGRILPALEGESSPSREGATWTRDVFALRSSCGNRDAGPARYPSLRLDGALSIPAQLRPRWGLCFGFARGDSGELAASAVGPDGQLAVGEDFPEDEVQVLVVIQVPRLKGQLNVREDPSLREASVAYGTGQPCASDLEGPAGLADGHACEVDDGIAVKIGG